MIAPKFSLRILLGVMAGIAALSFVARFAYQGHHWASAVLLSVGLVVFMFVHYVSAFLIALVVSLFDAILRPAAAPTTPFATNQPPPQVLPPRPPE